MTYGTGQLLEEVSYVAYHFHWPFDQILDLEHPLRREFVHRISTINATVNAASAVAEDGSGAEDAAGGAAARLANNGATGTWW